MKRFLIPRWILTRRALACLLPVVLAGLLIGPPAATGEPVASQPAAASIVARTAPPPEVEAAAITAVIEAARRTDVELLAGAQIGLPLTGVDAWAFKLIDGDGNPYAVAIDAGLEVVDAEQLWQAERELHAEIYGKLQPSLADQLEGADPRTALLVVIWLHQEEPDPERVPPRPDPEAVLDPGELDAVHQAMLDFVGQRVLATTEPLLPLLQSLDPSASAAELTPVLFAALTPEQIAEVAGWEEVETIYASPQYQRTLEFSSGTLGLPYAQQQGLDGFGTRLGLVEVGGIIDASNPYMPTITQNTSGACGHPHGTAVAGFMTSSHPWRTGMAPAAGLWVAGSCAGLTSMLAGATAWEVSQGVQAMNHSYGSYGGDEPEALDRMLDGFSFNLARIMVVAAGNGDAPCLPGNGIIGSPARGYNLISVGNLSDREPFGPPKMGECTSYVDPSSEMGDREKPEVSAPGTDMRSLTEAYPWTGAVGSGTSYAAPIVTGTAALLLQHQPNLVSWPEAVKAIFIASASNNVWGSRRLSDRDGAGGIQIDRAVETAFDGELPRWDATTYDCSAPEKIEVESFEALAGHTMRVALVWGQPNEYQDYAKRPAADLDLRILSPDNQVVKSSLSWDNTYEVVDFVPPDTGTYRIQVVQERCSMSPGFMGWAWAPHPVYDAPGLGIKAQGAGMDVAHIGQGTRPDLLLMAYDNSNGSSVFRYRIGWDLDEEGGAVNWSPVHDVPGVGDFGKGAGAKVAFVDGNLVPDLVLMAYDAPSGNGSFRYLVGRDLDPVTGQAAAWGAVKTVPGLDSGVTGADVEIVDLDSDPGKEMVLASYHENLSFDAFRYTVGWNLSDDGTASSWTTPPFVAQVSSADAQGLGVAFGQLDPNPLPDLMLLIGDDNAGNRFRYLLGRNVGANGQPPSWEGPFSLTGFYPGADGVGAAFWDLDGDGDEEALMMSYDQTSSGNVFRYLVRAP